MRNNLIKAGAAASASLPVAADGRGQPTASGSGRCLPETSSAQRDAGNDRRVEGAKRLSPVGGSQEASSATPP